MSSILVLTLGFMPISFGAAPAWKSDYAEATKLAKSMDKPVLVYFKNDAASDAGKKDIEVDKALLEPFVLVMADRSTKEGEKLFKLFEMNSDHGVVVVERQQNWQFCRYERQLESNELTEVLRQTSNATGKPATDKLPTIPATRIVGDRTSFYGNPTGATQMESATPVGNIGTWTMPQSSGGCPNCRRYQ